MVIRVGLGNDSFMVALGIESGKAVDYTHKKNKS